jgi:hypothetical protein
MAALKLGYPTTCAARSSVWADANRDLDGLHEVLALLVAIDPMERRVAMLVEDWLAHNKSSEAIYPVLGGLLRQPEFRKGILPFALRISDERPTDKGAGFLFSVLAETVQSMPAQQILELRGELAAGPNAKLTKALKWRGHR